MQYFLHATNVVCSIFLGKKMEPSTLFGMLFATLVAKKLSS